MRPARQALPHRRNGPQLRGWHARRVVHAIALLVGCGCAVPAPRPPAPAVQSAPHGGSFRDPQLACDTDGVCYITAIEITATEQHIFLAVSRDHGESWSRLPPLAAGVTGSRRRPQLVTGARREVYVIWEDTRAGQVGIWFNGSRDGGRSWFPADRRLDSGGANSHPRTPAFACDDRGDLYVLWLDDRDGFDTLYLNTSRDQGQNWESGDRRVGSLSLGRRSRLRVACDLEGSVYATWIEVSGGESRVFANSSADHASTWQFDAQPLSSGAPALGVDVCATDARTATAVWLAEESAADAIEAAITEDQGRSWRPVPLAGPTPPLRDLSLPRLAAAGALRVYAAWQGLAANQTSRIVLDASPDGGRSALRTVMAQLQPIGPTAFARDRRWLDSPFSLTADHVGNVYLAWIDGVIGAPHVAFQRLAAYGRASSELPQGPESAGHEPADAGAPQLASDDFGHVCMLWNEGHRLHVATSSFYGEAGWRDSDL
jgi:hypothetical protein